MSKIAFEDLYFLGSSENFTDLIVGGLYCTKDFKDILLITEKLQNPSTSYSYRGTYLNQGVTMFLTSEGKINVKEGADSDYFDIVHCIGLVEVNLPVTISGYFKEEDCSKVEFRVQDTGLHSIDLNCEGVMVDITKLIKDTLKAKYYNECIKELLQ